MGGGGGRGRCGVNIEGGYLGNTGVPISGPLAHDVELHEEGRLRLYEGARKLAEAVGAVPAKLNQWVRSTLIVSGRTLVLNVS